MPAPLVLRSFLMRLGYGVDKVGQKKFLNSLQTTKIRAQGASDSLDKMKGVAEKVRAPIQRLAEEMNNLFYSSRLADSTGGKLKGIANASEKAGIAADLVEKLAINMASWREMDPGKIAMLEVLTGVSTEGKAATDVIKEMLTSIAGMDTLQGGMVAAALGVDYETVRLWREFSKDIEKSDKAFQDMSRNMGLNWQEAATAGREYVNIQRDIGARWDVLTTKAKIAMLPSYKGVATAIANGLEWLTKHGITTTGGDAVNRANSPAEKARVAAMMDVQPTGRKGTREKAASGKKMTKAEYLSSLEEKYSLPKGVLDAIWAAESNRGKNTGRGVSSTGARTSAEGDFQIIDDTAKKLGLKNKHDFAEAANAAAKLLAENLKMFGGDLERAVVAYHDGPKAVREHGPRSHLLTPDGQRYFPNVQRHMEQARLGKDPGQERGNSTIHQTNHTTIAVNESQNPVTTAKEIGSRWNSTVRANSSTFFPRG